MKDVRQLGCALKDTEPPESSLILRKGTKVLEPIRRVRFTRAALRQANIRENKSPSLGKIQVKISHQRSHHATKFEDRSQEEIERQELRPRRRVETCQEYLSAQRKGQNYIISPTNEWSLLAASTIKLYKESLWWTPEQACIRSAGETLTLSIWNCESL